MTGTSLDGVDAVLAAYADGRPQARAQVHQPLADDLREALLRLNRPGDDELHRAAVAGQHLARVYAAAVDEPLVEAGVAARQVRAIGAHGQTVRHRPEAGCTIQVNAPATLAELTGIDAPVLGFDCGPGNVLIDAWAAEHLGEPVDRDRRWAAGDRVQAPLLAALLDDPCFALAPPKSTGRDRFNPDWLEGRLARVPGVDPQDVQATLTQLTATVIGEAIGRYYDEAEEVVVCGGGAFNAHLMARLAEACSPRPVVSSAALGVAPDPVEALAFAWLAREFVERRCANLPAVTGAGGRRRLGALYPRTKRTGRPRRPASCATAPAQTENDDPQPQVVVALGFLITNWAPSRSSL
jgi:anhydro-N-acetylmuramic acid kinase